MRKFLHFLFIVATMHQAVQASAALPKDFTQLPKNFTDSFKRIDGLFDDRDLSKKLTDEEKKRLDPATLALLASPEGQDLLHKISGHSNQRKVGHDDGRIASYTGKPIEPTDLIIALTSSAQPTLEQTAESLKSKGLAHNFLIDLDGQIYFAGKENETVEQALTHRPFSMGISAFVRDGWYQERDGNSCTISISMIGKSTEPTNDGQNEALAQLLAWTQQTYKITPERVKDYGEVAYFYGRREMSPNLPWQFLAERNLVVQPKKEHMTQIFATSDAESKPLQKLFEPCGVALMLNKIGLMCPPVHRYNNSKHDDKDNANDIRAHFERAMQAFQKRYGSKQPTGKPTPQDIAKLISVVAQHEQYNEKLKDIEPNCSRFLYKNN